MKILALSDRVEEVIYSPQIRDRYGDVDLVLGCGDLPYYYLEYVATMLVAPVLYVHGNHDRPVYMDSGRVVSEPGGCIRLDGRTARTGGLLLAGLGGSIRYNPRADHQYSEGAMQGRVMELIPGLLFNRLRYGRYLDVLVTHSPPFGIHDDTDAAHTGFRVFLTLMRLFKPALLLHGHTHIVGQKGETATRFHETTVINVYPSRVVGWRDDGQLIY